MAANMAAGARKRQKTAHDGGAEGGDAPEDGAFVPGIAEEPCGPETGVVSRYYRRFSFPESVYVHAHPNGIVVVGMDASHSALSSDVRLTGVNWDVSVGGRDLREQVSKLHGKKKKGAMHIPCGFPLCEIVATAPDGAEQRWTIRSPVAGTVVEVNRQLEGHPEVLRENPQFEGFLAIMQMKPGHISLLERAARSTVNG